MENKVFFIAGAAGFIPSHVVDFYLESGAKVIGVDNFITGQRCNLDLAFKNTGFQFLEGDIVSEKAFSSLKNAKIDYVLNFASPASPIDFSKIPLEIMQVNSQGSKNLLELARQSNARYLEVSTSEVYGDPLEHPQVESYWGNVNPIGVRSCYDEAKRFAEALTMTYHRHFGLDTRIVRVFNTYGPRMRETDGRVMPNFINQALQGLPLTIYGEGEQTRSFCFVNDLIQGIHNVLFSKCTSPVNVGNANEISIRELAGLVLKITKSSSELVKAPLPGDDPQRRRPNLAKLKSLGDYTPKISLEAGLKQTISYFQGRM